MPPEIDMAAIKALPIGECIALADAIWDSIEGESEANDLSDAQKTELQRRLDLYRADPTNVVPWETVKAQARKRAKR
jgi:putative addiction module component (TIGR02574 family)